MMNDRPIGPDTMNRIDAVAARLLKYTRDRFEPNEEIYRINDFADYVSKQVFDAVWQGHPAWWVDAWMLSDNGSYTRDDVCAMTIDEVERAITASSYEPQYAYYTEADEFGLP